MHGNFSRVCPFAFLTWTILWLLETGCAFNYTKIGCFKDDRKNPRPVPVLVFTDRDVSSDVWSGNTIGWPNWDTYIVDLVCRCANESRARNYSHFSIQYYGNCQANIVRGFLGNWRPTLPLSPLRAKLWVRGGVGGQFPRNLQMSQGQGTIPTSAFSITVTDKWIEVSG